MNKIIRKCSNCNHEGDQSDGNFGYLGDGIWQCPCCCSKYTEIKEVVESEE